ncbi:MAG: SEL1-like repeat protein, partial [Proteobacteria bacterium]|nr:SEL1-like repeat protein [Pseudomonadota bacterium]
MKDGLNSDRDLFCMLDFHGYTVEEARVSINQAFAKAPEEKTREIYIITGRGNHRNADGSHGVLKKALPKLLKPYKKFILEIIEENAAYRIILQKVPLLQPMFDPFLLMAFKMGLNLESYLKMLNTDAEKGDLEAKLELAKLLLSTESGKDRDVKKGILLLQELYEKKSVEACYLLGHIFIEGCEGLDVDYKNGLKYLNEAAAMGSSPAYADLAICYLLGKGVHHSDEKAAEYLKKLADEFNNAWAAAHLGRYYFEGTVVSQDYELAVKYLKIAAKADGSNPGNATSQVYLARCHAMGYGVPRDYKTAYQYYCAAAKQNNVYALHMLGLYSEIGRATPPNLVMAFHFYDRAAVLGDLDSYGRTALFRIHAKGTTRDVEQGLRQLE